MEKPGLGYSPLPALHLPSAAIYRDANHRHLSASIGAVQEYDLNAPLCSCADSSRDVDCSDVTR